MKHISQHLQTAFKRLTHLATVLLLILTPLFVLLPAQTYGVGVIPDTPLAGYPTTNGSASVIVAAPDGSQYIGGSFTEIGGATRNRLAHVLADGSVDINFDPDIGVDPWNGVSALALDTSTNTLYAGGNFTVVNGSTPRNYLAAFDTSTGTATSFDPNMGAGIHTLAFDPSTNTLYAGGDFTAVNGSTARNHLAAFDTDTGTATSFDPDVDQAPASLALSDDGSSLYAGGWFTTVNGSTARNRLAAFDTSTGTATSFDPNVGGIDGVSSIALDTSTNTLYAGGLFTVVNGGTTRNNLAAFNTDTGTATSFDPNVEGVSFWGGVRSLALDTSTNTLYAGGSFTTVNGSTARRSLAAFNTDTGTATSFDPNVETDINGLALDTSTNTLYAGGYFTTINGESHTNLAAFRGSVPAPPEPGPTPDPGEGPTLNVDNLASTGGSVIIRYLIAATLISCGVVTLGYLLMRSKN